MKAYDIEVTVEDGLIVIYQTRTYGMAGTDESVEISPDQVDMLVAWLKEAKAEAQK